jgi:caa(3)-type oxidase subunit IV
MEQAAQLSLGARVLIGLAVLTGAEFWVAVSGVGGASFVLLALIALAKAALILEYFMHVGKLSPSESGGDG